jgi:hypothetical protein
MTLDIVMMMNRVFVTVVSMFTLSDTIVLRTHKKNRSFVKCKLLTQRNFSPTSKVYHRKIFLLRQNVYILCIIRPGHVFISLKLFVNFCVMFADYKTACSL